MEWVTLTAIALAALGAYLLPSIIALARNAPSSASTIVINVLLGWTLLGWVASLAMALRSHPPATVVQVQPAPGGQTVRSLPGPWPGPTRTTAPEVEDPAAGQSRDARPWL